MNGRVIKFGKVLEGLDIGNKVYTNTDARGFGKQNAFHYLNRQAITEKLADGVDVFLRTNKFIFDSDIEECLRTLCNRRIIPVPPSSGFTIEYFAACLSEAYDKERLKSDSRFKNIFLKKAIGDYVTKQIEHFLEPCAEKKTPLEICCGGNLLYARYWPDQLIFYRHHRSLNSLVRVCSRIVLVPYIVKK